MIIGPAWIEFCASVKMSPDALASGSEPDMAMIGGCSEGSEWKLCVNPFESRMSCDGLSARAKPGVAAASTSDETTLSFLIRVILGVRRNRPARAIATRPAAESLDRAAI